MRLKWLLQDREDQISEAKSKTHLETNQIKARIRDASDSEGSWSSVDEEEGKIAKESNEEVFFDDNVNDKLKSNKNKSFDKSDGKKNDQPDRKTWNVLEDLEDREETAQLKPLLASSFWIKRATASFTFIKKKRTPKLRLIY